MSAGQYGCWNRPDFATHYSVGKRPFLYQGEVIEEPVLIANAGSKDCNYTHTALGQTDAKCAGCNHKVET